MKRRYNSFIVFLGVLLSLMACAPPEDRIRQQLAVLQEPEGVVLLYEHTHTSSGATGACSGTHTHRWYGTDMSFIELQEIYERQLMERGWTTWPDDTEGIWRMEEQAGLFTLALADFSDGVDPDRLLYTLPDEVLEEMQDLQTVYFLNLGFMDSSHARRCFGK